MKVLIIDDDGTSRLILSKLLQNLNIQVLTAENGQIGLNLYEKHGDVDVVVTDCQMPVMCGYETLRAIHRIDESSGSYSSLFVSSGRSKEELKPFFKDLPIIEYFQKPMNHESFYQALLSTQKSKLIR